MSIDARDFTLDEIVSENKKLKELIIIGENNNINPVSIPKTFVFYDCKLILKAAKSERLKKVIIVAGVFNKCFENMYNLTNIDTLYICNGYDFPLENSTIYEQENYSWYPSNEKMEDLKKHLPNTKLIIRQKGFFEFIYHGIPLKNK